MPSMNRVILAGNLTKAPKQISKPEKKLCVVIRVATNERFGEQDTATFTDCKMFERMAECALEQLKMGSGVIVEGKLRNYEYVDKSGATQRTMVVYTDRWQHTDKKPKNTEDFNSADEIVNENDFDSILT